jgi:hypothetical protein
MILEEIAKMVSRELDVDIFKNTRKREVVYGRVIYYRLAREYTPLSLREIGSLFNRHHATALHGFKLFSAFRMQPKLYSKELDAYDKISKVLSKMKPEKKKTKLEQIILEKEEEYNRIVMFHVKKTEEALHERDQIKEEYEKLKNKHNNLMKFFSKYESTAYERYAV